jgi:XTP/dITP diphosphohydrolase
VKIFLASSNQGKLREFREAALEKGVTVEALPRIGDLPPCVEDGDSFESNARKKALHYAAWTEGRVFADDSGLCVDALEGRPGIHSARFARAGASDKENNRRLLEELRGVPPARRTAHYLCVIALAEGCRVLAVTEGRVDGIILESPRGSGGFGYDPLFFFPPLDRTFAELTAEEKFTVSHRGEAFRKLLDCLRHP